MRAALWDAPIAEGEAILGGMRAARRETDLRRLELVSWVGSEWLLFCC